MPEDRRSRLAENVAFDIAMDTFVPHTSMFVRFRKVVLLRSENRKLAFVSYNQPIIIFCKDKNYKSLYLTMIWCDFFSENTSYLHKNYRGY